jgi:uncharacterized protein (DUF2235 family)
MLFGFSRGAYAVRSLAGFVERVGLVRRDVATERMIQQAFRFYETDRLSRSGRLFRRHNCHARVPIEVIGVWDTIKALGLPYPLISRLAPMATEFHDDALGPNVRNAFQALALDEDRVAYAPMPWRVAPDWKGRVEQVWFAGAHSDVGGHVWKFPAARQLSNIPLRWMIDRAVRCGLIVPEDWQARFPTDPGAPARGNRSGQGRLFWNREPREIGGCSSEDVHPSVLHRMRLVPGYRPLAEWMEPEAAGEVPSFT